MYPRLKLWSLSCGLAAWAAVSWVRVNPATDLTSLQGSATARADVGDPVRSPARLYAESCAGCHQGRGEGRFPAFPPLAGSPWATGDRDRLIALTLHGVSGPIEVNGVRYAGMMPGFSHLDDREIADVLTHVRSSWGNRASAITVEDVAAIRAATADRRIPWSATELAAQAERAR